MTFVSTSSSGLKATGFPMGSGNTMTMWWVGTSPTSPDDFNARVISYTAPGTTDGNSAGSFCLYKGASGQNFFTYLRNGSEGNIGILPASTSPLRMILTVRSDGFWRYYINNSVVYWDGPTTIAGSWITGGAFTLGRYAGGGTGWNGPMAEVGIATGYLDATGVSALDTYLKAKWGL